MKNVWTASVSLMTTKGKPSRKAHQTKPYASYAALIRHGVMPVIPEGNTAQVIVYNDKSSAIEWRKK